MCIFICCFISLFLRYSDMPLIDSVVVRYFHSLVKLVLICFTMFVQFVEVKRSNTCKLNYLILFSVSLHVCGLSIDLANSCLCHINAHTHGKTIFRLYLISINVIYNFWWNSYCRVIWQGISSKNDKWFVPLAAAAALNQQLILSCLRNIYCHSSTLEKKKITSH